LDAIHKVVKVRSGCDVVIVELEDNIRVDGFESVLGGFDLGKTLLLGAVEESGSWRESGRDGMKTSQTNLQFFKQDLFMLASSTLS